MRARGALPLVVGGTMLYAKALREGLSDLPAADVEVRARLEAEAALQGWPAMHARLASVDPVTAARLKPNDSQRIQRALEVFEVTGVPMAQLHTAPQRPALDLAVIALLPEDRAALHRRIEERFDAMLAHGFLDEVKALRARGDLHPDLPSMRSVGYRQAWAHLEGIDGFRRVPRRRHRGHAPAGEAPDHVAAVDARRDLDRSVRGGCLRTCASGGRGGRGRAIVVQVERVVLV